MPTEVKYTPNTSRLIGSADYGIRVAKSSYDATGCANSELLFNSNWPILQIAKVINIKASRSTLVESTDGFDPNAHFESTIDYDNPLYGTNSRLALDSTFVYTKIDFQQKPENDGTAKYEYRMYGFPHGLGFTPMFFLSKEISGQDGYLFLMGVDITTDIDYPYNDAPSSYIGLTRDYGIKGKDDKGKRGADINVQSKLVQAVKTLETSTTTFEVRDNGRKSISKGIVWTPPKDSEFSNNILDYEVYGYAGLPTKKSYGRVYRRAEYSPQTSGTIGYKAENSATMLLAYSRGQDEGTIVVVRAPMFSPLVEAFTYE